MLGHRFCQCGLLRLYWVYSSKHETSTQCWLIVGQRFRRWPNIKPTLRQRLVLLGFGYPRLIVYPIITLTPRTGRGDIDHRLPIGGDLDLHQSEARDPYIVEPTGVAGRGCRELPLIRESFSTVDSINLSAGVDRTPCWLTSTAQRSGACVCSGPRCLSLDRPRFTIGCLRNYYVMSSMQQCSKDSVLHDRLWIINQNRFQGSCNYVGTSRNGPVIPLIMRPMANSMGFLKFRLHTLY